MNTTTGETPRLSEVLSDPATQRMMRGDTIPEKDLSSLLQQIKHALGYCDSQPQA